VWNRVLGLEEGDTLPQPENHKKEKIVLTLGVGGG